MDETYDPTTSESETLFDVDAFVDQVLREEVEEFDVHSVSTTSLSKAAHGIDMVNIEGDQLDDGDSYDDDDDYDDDDSKPIKSYSTLNHNLEEAISSDEDVPDLGYEHSYRDEDNSMEGPINLDYEVLYDQLHALGPQRFVEEQMAQGHALKEVLDAFDLPLPIGLVRADPMAQWLYLLRYLERHIYKRPRLGLSSLQDVVDLLQKSQRILVVTGAGISVNCGIPDFRSKGGLYARIQEEYALPQPECMFDIEYFRVDPEPFYSFARELLPKEEYNASFSHHFIADLERHGQLLRLYTQNIDMLEQDAGINRLIYCHGSFASATCLDCGQKTTFEKFKEQLQHNKVIYCNECEGLVKPDIVFFGESLPPTFEENIKRDCQQADLLLVIGSSMKVLPVSSIPDMLPPHIPQILINKESLRDHNYDIELLGDCDIILAELLCKLERTMDGVPGSRFRTLIESSLTEQCYKFVEPFYHIFPGTDSANPTPKEDENDVGDEEEFPNEKALLIN